MVIGDFTVLIALFDHNTPAARLIPQTI